MATNQEVIERLDKMDAKLDEVRDDVRTILVQQARHDEQIGFIKKIGGGALGVLITTAVAAFRTALGL